MEFKMGKHKIVFDKDRVEEAKQIRLALREGLPMGRVPFEFLPEMPPYKYTMGERVKDMEKELEYQVDFMNFRFREFPDSDYIPYFTTVHLGQGMIPSMFGAKQVIVEHNQPFIEGRVMESLENDLAKLPKRINPDTDGWGPILRKTVETFLDAADGEIPVCVCDHQSPYGIATKLIGNENLMMAMYDTPELVHDLMDIVTNAISDTIRAMERWAGNPDLIVKNDCDPMPGGGLILWDDYISVISPKLHEEFCLPYNSRLYREFGRGHLHTCGPNFPRYIDAVLKNDPVSIDAIFLRGTARTREDLLEMKRITREKGIILRGSLITYENHFLDSNEAILPDADLFDAMADGGGFYWYEWGKKETGVQLSDTIKRWNRRI